MIRLTWSRRKVTATALVCAIFVITSTVFWQINQNAQAAMIYPHPGMVGWWRFDEGTGTIATDNSGYGNDATIYGASWVNGKYGNALQFNGVDNSVQVPTDLQFGAGNFSVCFWFRAGELNRLQALIEKMTGWNDERWNIRLTVSNSICVELLDNGIVKEIGSTTNANLGVWLHVVFVRDGDNAYLYVNSVLENSAAGISTMSFSGSGPLSIGRYALGNDIFFNGVVDEVRVYNRALSQSEIQEIFQEVPDFSSKLLAKIPKGTTQVIITASWLGIGSLNATIDSPSESYTEEMVPVYGKTSYSTLGDTSEILNIKRLSIAIPALSFEENWYITLDLDNVEDYKITVEIQK